MRQIAQATRFGDGSRVVHIGLPKTGTSALQASLNASRTMLAEHGVANVTHGRHQYYAAKAAAGSLEPWYGREPYQRWDDLAMRLRTSSSRLGVLSSEMLSKASPERINAIVDQLGPDLQIVVTLRAFAPLLASQWQQDLRRMQTLSLPDWISAKLYSPKGDDAVLPRLSLPRIVREWGAAVGEDRLTFVMPDPADRLSLLHHFADLLGVPYDALPPQDHDNASLPYPEAEMLRHFNIAFLAGGGDRATFMQTVTAEGHPRFGRLRGLQPAPISLSRSEAARANEVAQGWIDGIAHSGVTVVGDLSHLLVDVDAYPEEVPAPTSVTIESAGEVAEILFDVALGHNPNDDPATAAEHGQPDSRADLSIYSARQLMGEVRRRAGRRLRKH